jgi:hypothetical protein
MMSRENDSGRFDVFNSGFGEDWVSDFDIKHYVKQHPSTLGQNPRSKVNKAMDNIERLEQLGEDAEDILGEALDILISKHADYGPLNILNAPGGPYAGLAVRLHDKVARLANLTGTGQEPRHESIRDTFLDILNYGLIGILVLEDKWGE